MLFVHENWAQSGFLDHIKARAETRQLEDMTIGPVFTWSNEMLSEQVCAGAF